MGLRSFNPTDTSIHKALVDLWNEACSERLHITPRLVAFNTTPSPGITQAGSLTVDGDEIVGFVLASSDGSGQGWIDALAVRSIRRNEGFGETMLSWAEEWLAGQGARSVRLGGSLRPFVPGLPRELSTEFFFRRRGYTGARVEWDVARSLTDYFPPPRPSGQFTVAPVQPGKEHELIAFLERTFPGRWAWECREFFRLGGRSSDYLILEDGGGIQGFCQVTFEDSLRPIDRFYLHGLPHRWGQLGPIGVSEECRGRGYGRALIEAGLHYLKRHYVAGCVIDWTTLVDLYARFGFKPSRSYLVLSKEIA